MRYYHLSQIPPIKKRPDSNESGRFNLNPGDDLLSHGETPHYHRRYIVSLLSSGWDQVVPMLYGRQENLYECEALLFPNLMGELCASNSNRVVKMLKQRVLIQDIHLFVMQSSLLYGQASRAISTG